MSFQVGIGDAVLLAKISWRVAQAFTKGRNSAPAEFCEVENQLYALSTALKTVKETYSNPYNSRSQSPETEPHVSRILGNCHVTLRHLESIVTKYSVVLEQNDDNKPRFNRWSQSLIRNWRKIEWTTEKGDLAALRSQLMVYINTLSLLNGINTHNHTTNIKDSLSEVSEMVRDLHSWYERNLVNLRRADSKRITTTVGDNITQDLRQQATFQLALNMHKDPQIVCPRAYINPAWREALCKDSELHSSEPMFECCCISKPGKRSGCSVQLAAYTDTSSTFPVRIVGTERTWIIFKVADTRHNMLVSLRISRIDPRYTSAFEQTVLEPLATRQADRILQNRLDNSLAYTAPGSGEQRVLARFGSMPIAEQSLEFVKIVVGGRVLIREYVTSVNILQYGSLSQLSKGETCLHGPVEPIDTAEIFITHDEGDAIEKGEVLNHTMELKRSTESKLDDETSAVTITSIDISGRPQGTGLTNITNAEVVFQFASSEASREFHQTLQAMRTELFIRGLLYPNSKEIILLQLGMTQVECEGFYIEEATMTIFQNLETSQCRLTIASHGKATILSQDLPSDFFYRSPPVYSGSSYVVHVDAAGVRRLYSFPEGFKDLNFRAEQSRQAFELARGAVSLALPQQG